MEGEVRRQISISLYEYKQKQILTYVINQVTSMLEEQDQATSTTTVALSARVRRISLLRSGRVATD